MVSNAILSEFHKRAHTSFAMMLKHCRELTDDELNRQIDGFGVSTVRLQFHHQIGAERYWISVLKGRMDVEDDSDRYLTIDAMNEFRLKVFTTTEEYLNTASEDELITPRKMMTWGNKERILVPTHVFMRTLTHIYHHHGQIAAMCRIMGKPIPLGMDYPVIE